MVAVPAVSPQPPEGYGKPFVGSFKRFFFAVRSVGNHYEVPELLESVTFDPWMPQDLVRMILNRLDIFTPGETYLSKIFYVNYCDHHPMDFSNRLIRIPLYSLLDENEGPHVTQEELHEEAGEFREVAFSVREVREGHKMISLISLFHDTRF